MHNLHVLNIFNRIDLIQKCGDICISAGLNNQDILFFNSGNLSLVHCISSLV